MIPETDTTCSNIARLPVTYQRSWQPEEIHFLWIVYCPISLACARDLTSAFPDNGTSQYKLLIEIKFTYVNDDFKRQPSLHQVCVMHLCLETVVIQNSTL